MRFPDIVLPTWTHTVTIFNRLAGRDSPDQLDHWKPTVLYGCFWSGKQTRGTSSRLSTAMEINEGASYLLRVPQSEKYRAYRDWKVDMAGFTFSTGDYVILGELTEEDTLENIQQLVERFRPNAFEVQLFRDNTGGPLPHYRVEGV